MFRWEDFGFVSVSFLGSSQHSLSLSENILAAVLKQPPANDCGGSIFIGGDPKVRNDWFDPKWQFDKCPQRSDLSSRCNITCGTSKADSQSEFSFEGLKYEAFAIET